MKGMNDMGLLDRVVDKVADKALTLATKKIQEIMTEAVYKAADHAKTTANPWDDIIVEEIRRGLNIPRRDKPEEPPKRD